MGLGAYSQSDLGGEMSVNESPVRVTLTHEKSSHVPQSLRVASGFHQPRAPDIIREQDCHTIYILGLMHTSRE